jgi:hypothetical protein
MSEQHRLLSVVAAAAGGLAAAAFLPVALANADDCSLFDCTLVSGGDPTNVVYQGVRPRFADWKDDQPTNVEVTQSDGNSFVSGSYDVSEQDYESKARDQAIYKFGEFTPSQSNTTGIDSDDLAGTKVYDYWSGPFGTNAEGDPTYRMNNLNIFYGDGDRTEIHTVTGDYTTFLIGEGHSTGEWILYAGQTTPQELWDSLPSSQFPTEYIDTLSQNVLPPDDWFPLGNGDLGPIADLVSALDLGSAASSAADLGSVAASSAADLGSLIDVGSFLP